MQKDRAAEAVAAIIILTALSKVLGFVREVVIAAHFGAGAVTDAYLTAVLVSLFIFNLPGGRLLGTAFIPVYSGVAAAGPQERAEKFTGTVLTLAFIIFSLAALIGILLSPILVAAVAPGLPLMTREMAVCFTRLLMAGLPILALSGLLASLLNIHNNFSVPAAFGIPLNLTVIGFIFFSGAGAAIGLVAGTLAGYLSQVLISLPALTKRNVRICGGVDFREQGLIRMGTFLLPLIAGGIVLQLNPLVIRFLASGMPEGTISILNYADRIVLVIQELLVTTVITVSYPVISGAFARKRREEINETVNFWAGVLIFTTAPVALVMAFTCHPLVRLAFERGVFGSSAAGATAEALFYYSLGLPFVALSRFIARVFYTCLDSRAPLLIGIGVVIINIIFCLLLLKPMGGGGLALAATISAVVSIPVSLGCLKSRTGIALSRVTWKKIGSIGAATLAAALVMTAASAAAGGTGIEGKWGDLLYLAAVGGSGMLCYFLAARFFKLEEVEVVMALFKNVKFLFRWD